MSAVYDSYMRKIKNRNKERKRSSSRHVQRYISDEKKLISRDKFYRIFAEFTYPPKYGLQPKFLSTDDRFRELLKAKKQDRSDIKVHLNRIFTNPDHPFNNLVRQFVNLFHASYALCPEMLKQKSYDNSNAEKNFNHKIKRLLRCAVHDIKSFVTQTKMLLKRTFPGMDTKAHDYICQTELHQHLFKLLVPSLLDLYLLSNRDQNIAFRLACVELSKTHNLGSLGVSKELQLIPPVEQEKTNEGLTEKLSLDEIRLQTVPELQVTNRQPETPGSSKQIVESNVTLNSPSTSSPERGEMMKDCCGGHISRTRVPLSALGSKRRLSTEIDLPPASFPARQGEGFIVNQVTRDRRKSQPVIIQRGYSNTAGQRSRLSSASAPAPLVVDETSGETAAERKRKPKRAESFGYNFHKDESLSSLSMGFLGMTHGLQESKTPPRSSGNSETLTLDDYDVQFKKEVVPQRQRTKTTSLLSASLKRSPEVRPRVTSPKKEIPYQPAVDCIKSIDKHEAPEDKIRVLSKAIDLCCKSIDAFYEKYPCENAKQQRICPDDLLSIFSYLLINTHCDSFISQLQFIEDFVTDNLRCDVMGYYLATAKAATNIVLMNYQQVLRKCNSL